MTLLPCEQQRIGKGSTAADYEFLLPMECQRPECRELGMHKHHIVRRSHLAGAYDYVEIDGVVRPNLIALCHYCHQQVTENRVKVWWDEGEWCWAEPGVSLSPPLRIVHGTPVGGSERYAHESAGPDSMLAEVEPREGSPGPGSAVDLPGEAEPITGGSESDSVAKDPGTTPPPSLPSPGEKCPTCQRRVNHPKQDTSPVSKTKSFRVPADVLEEFNEIEEAVIAHIGEEGGKYVKYKAVLSGYISLLQGPGGERAS